MSQPDRIDPLHRQPGSIPDDMITCAASALRRIPRRAESNAADDDQLREWAKAALTAARVPEILQYEDRGDFVVYRDEWDRVHRELEAARKELAGRLRELEKLYAVLNKTRTARDTLANFIEAEVAGSQVHRDTGSVLT